MLKMFCNLLKGADARSIEISFSDRDEELYGFLEAENFLLFEEKSRYSVPIEDLIYSEAIEGLEEGRKAPGQIQRAAELADPRQLLKYLSDKNISCFVNIDEITKFSLVLLDDRDDINGCMMVVKEPKGDVQIPYLVNDGPTECIIDLFLTLKALIIEKG